MQKIYTAADSAEAQILKSLLEANGIPCLIQGWHHRSLVGLLGPYVALNLLVEDSQAEEAELLIKEFKKADFVDPNFPPENEPTQTSKEATNKMLSKNLLFRGILFAFVCPGLGSCVVGKRSIGEWLVWLTIIFFSSFVILRSNHHPFSSYFVLCLPIVALLDLVFVLSHWKKTLKRS